MDVAHAAGVVVHIAVFSGEGGRVFQVILAVGIGVQQDAAGQHLAQPGGAAAVGAGLAARRFLGRGAQLPKGPARSATQPIKTADLQEMVNGPIGRVANTRVTQSAPQETVRVPATPAAQAEPKAPAVVEPSLPAPGTTENALAVDPTDRLIAEYQDMLATQASERASKSKALQTRMDTAYVRNLNQTATQLLDRLQNESLVRGLR